MEVNLANKIIRGCFGQKCLHLLAESLPLLSAILTYFQMSVFSVPWGDCKREVARRKSDLDKDLSLHLMDRAKKAGRCLWENGIKRTAEIWMGGKQRPGQGKDGKPNCNEVLMQGHCQRLLDRRCCIVDQHPMTRLKENLEARMTHAEERRAGQDGSLLTFVMCLMLSQCR